MITRWLVRFVETDFEAGSGFTLLAEASKIYGQGLSGTPLPFSPVG